MSTKPKKQPKPKAAEATPRRKRKPAAAKKPEPVTAQLEPKAPATRRVALRPMALGDHITAVKPCPHKPGSKSAANFAKYREGMTVEEALSKGCPHEYIRWDRRYGHIAIGE
ncbi:MAG: hypothetical protein ACREDO_05390 [Methyloceanibacter sp.]